MTHVLISYAHEEREKAQHLAKVLSQLDFDVWWDRKLSPGEDFAEKIEGQIRAAQAVVVMWSEHSIKSRWVLGEADLADQLGKLVTVRVDECELPINFRNLHSPCIFQSADELKSLIQLLQRIKSDNTEGLSQSELEQQADDAFSVTTTDAFWKDYWTLTVSSLKQPLAFSENAEKSASFAKKHEASMKGFLKTYLKWLIVFFAVVSFLGLLGG